jgi:hypothetical protein
VNNNIDKLTNKIYNLELILNNPPEYMDEDLKKRIQGLVQELKKTSEVSFALNSTISTQNILTEKSLEIISKDEKYFVPKDKNQFDDFCKNLIATVVDLKENSNLCYLESIFKKFDAIELEKYLDKFLNYLFAMDYKSQTIEKIINMQILAIDPQNLVRCAQEKEGVEQEKLFRDFYLFLKSAHSLQDLVDEDVLKGKMVRLAEWMQKNYGQLKELFFGDLKNLIIADEIMSSEIPTSIWNAQAVFGSQLMKLQSLTPLASPPTMVIGMAVSAGMMTFDYRLALWLLALNLAPFAIPLSLSFCRKVYLQWILNAPLSLEPLTNYSVKNNGFSKNFIGRKNVFEKIIKIWRNHKHPLLVGFPGTGKTSIFMELGRRIANGEFSDLKEKTMFAGSAALILGNGIDPSIFPKLVKVLQIHKKSVIFGLDEVHVLAKDEKILTHLRSVTDESNESLRYCIFATTPEEYEKTIAKDESLKRRFTKVEINPLSKNELLNLLHKEAKTISSQISVTQAAMIAIYDEAKGLQNESSKLLYKIIMAVEAKNKDIPIFQELDKKNSELNLKRILLKSEENTLEQTNQLCSEIDQDEEEIIKLEVACKEQEKIQEKYKVMKDDLIKTKNKLILEAKSFFSHFDKVTEKSLSKEVRIKKFEEHLLSSYNQVTMKHLIFKQYFLIPHRIKLIREYEKIHGFNSVIDEGLVKDLK